MLKEIGKHFDIGDFEAVDAYLTGALFSSKFRMPGCGTRHDNGFREGN